MEELEGGRPGIVRIGDRVHRPAGLWTNQVQRLLRHVRNAGFEGAPEPFGFDDDGREIVSYLTGEVTNYPLSLNARSDEALTSAARLLRTYHDASEGFLADEISDELWQLPSRAPREVVCHGDFAPYNVVLNGQSAVGMIDFDTAHPGPRSWDIAYALYRWAPFTNPDNADGFGELAGQIARGKKFCDAYGLSIGERVGLAGAISERLRLLVEFMVHQAAGGSAKFTANLRDGHHLGYIADREYVDSHRRAIDAGLAGA